MYNIRLLGVQQLTGCVLKHWESNNTKYTTHVSYTPNGLKLDQNKKKEHKHNTKIESAVAAHRNPDPEGSGFMITE